MAAQPDDSGVEGGRRSFYWQWFNRIALVLGAIAAAGSLLGVWLQAKVAQPSAQFEVLSTERLYPSTSVQGIDLSATHQGEPIRNLWKLRFRGVNDGDQVIVGRGAKSTLLEESIQIAFDSPIKVLGTDREGGNFPHQLKPTLAGELQLSFDQWKTGESFIYSIYLTVLTSENKPRPILPRRDLVGGEIKVVDRSDLASISPKPLIDRLSSPAVIIGRVIAILFAVVLILVGIYAGVRMYVDFWRHWRWQRNFGEAIRKFILEQEGISEANKDRFLSDPWSLYYSPSQMPKPQGIPSPPVPPPMKTWAQVAGFLLAMISVVVGGVAQIASIIIW